MSDDLITLAAFQSAVEAQNCRAALEQHGIEAVLADEHTVTSDWLYSAGVGGVKLRVSPADADAARQVLSGARATAVGCPRCGSPRTRRDLPRGWMSLALLVMAVSGLPFAPFWMRRWKCAGCGHRWKSRFEAEAGEPESPGTKRPPVPDSEAPPAGALFTALAPWRGRDGCLRVGMVLAALTLVFAGQLGSWVLLAAPLVLLATLGLGAFFTWEWEQVTVTGEVLVLDDPEGRTVIPLAALSACEAGDGSRLVSDAHGPLLADASAGAAPPGATLLRDADMDAIWELVRARPPL
jgi:hypothetical protein